MNMDDNSSNSQVDDQTLLTSVDDDLSSLGYSWTDEWDHTCWDEPDYFRPRTPMSPPPIPHYTGLKLEMLSKPEYMMTESKDGDTWGIANRRRRHSKFVAPKKRLVLEEEEKKPESPKGSMWKKIEVMDRKDPWAFLEEKKPVPKPRVAPPKERVHHHHSTTSNTSSSQDRDCSKLCKYKDDCRMNKSGRCTMVHSLREWKPRICKFNNRCNKKQVCGYYHADQPIRDFLVQMLKRKDSIYQKNSMFYEKYL